MFFAVFFFLLSSILTLLSVYCHAFPALSVGLLQELMNAVYAHDSCVSVCVCVHLKGLVERKEKVTKESMCICYSLSGVLLTLQTPPDGFLVNVKRAGATDWFLWHAQKAFSCGYLHSFHPQAVKCILYCVAPALCMCVCANVALGGEKDHALFKPLLSEDVC